MELVFHRHACKAGDLTDVIAAHTSSPMTAVHQSGAKASVIILTGFLGSGKTTLLNRILTAEHGRQIAVIVNEFGAVGIDHHLLLSSNQEVVQMNNGCICCTVRGDLVRSFFQLLDHREKFDTVVIETTGLAEPAPVAQSIYSDERIRSRFTLAGVVTVVDAKYISTRLRRVGRGVRADRFRRLDRT